MREALPMLAHLFGVMPWHIEGPEHLTYLEIVAFIETGQRLTEGPGGS